MTDMERKLNALGLQYSGSCGLCGAQTQGDRCPRCGGAAGVKKQVKMPKWMVRSLRRQDLLK